MLGRVIRSLLARLLADRRHLVVSVTGENAAADRLRAALTLHPRYTLSALAPQFTFQVEEADVDVVVFDGVKSLLEMHVAHEVCELTPAKRFHVLGSCGQNFDDRALRILCPADDRYRAAVADGVCLGLDFLRTQVLR